MSRAKLVKKKGFEKKSEDYTVTKQVVLQIPELLLGIRLDDLARLSQEACWLAGKRCENREEMARRLGGACVVFREMAGELIGNGKDDDAGGGDNGADSVEGARNEVAGG